MKRKESLAHRYIKDENFTANGREGMDSISKGYKGVLFFEEEDDNASKRRISHQATGPYDDDDDEDEDDDIETEDFYPDNDDYNVETSKPARKRSLYE